MHDIKLYIATAKRCNAAKWKNERTSWVKVAESLNQTERTKETLKQYFSYTKDKQDEIKDVGGFVGGKLLPGTAKIKGKDVTFVEPYGWRRKGFVDHRQLVALDVDFGDLDVWLDFKLLEAAGLMYTTHKHQPDSPRFRIVFPLDRKVSPEEYECIARVVASWLNIEVFDDTTYQPTRLMYYPSTAKDGEFVYDFVDAPVLSADDILKELDDWTDVTTWPVSSREKEVRKATTDQVEDPNEKTGIVGAFCRAYTIEEAIAEFLSDVYRPCEELGDDRYSYIPGSTSGGLVLYDHKLAYSHHNTDPAGGKLSNAFDLVRLHKFADLDEKVKPDTDAAKLPSFRAMSEFAGNLKEVKKEVLRERRSSQTADYDDKIEEAREVGESDDWVDGLEMEGKTVKSTIDNVCLILNNDENLKGRLQLNLLSMWDEVAKPFMWDKNVTRYPRPSDDNDINQIRRYVERCYGIAGDKLVTTGMAIVSYDNGHHPLKQYLDALPEWDKTSRLEELLIRLFGAADTPYTRAVTVKTFCAAVKRVYVPGTKFDHMLVLIGTGGNGKSTFLSKIGGEWFTDNVKLTTDDKQNLAIMRGRWILEIAEMSGFNKKEAEFTKQFLSSTEDIYKRPYDRKEIVFPRQSIFIGTHNKSEFLHDETGNRRYWPIQTTTGKKDAPKVWEYLTAVTVAQIWAEVKERVAQGEKLYLDLGLEQQAEAVQGQHLESDAWEELIYTHIADKDEVTTNEIWDIALSGGRPISKIEQNRIGKIMRLTEQWEYKDVRRQGIKFKAWVKISGISGNKRHETN